MKNCCILIDGDDPVTPHPLSRRTIGVPHGTETPLSDFLTLVGPFRSCFHNYINL